MEAAHLRHRSADRTQGAQINCPLARGRGRRRRLSQAHAAAARRLPLYPAGHHPASDTILIASLLATTQDRAPAVDRGVKPTKKAFKAYPIGYFHIDIAEVQIAEGKP